MQNAPPNIQKWMQIQPQSVPGKRLQHKLLSQLNFSVKQFHILSMNAILLSLLKYVSCGVLACRYQEKSTATTLSAALFMFGQESISPPEPPCRLLTPAINGFPSNWKKFTNSSTPSRYFRHLVSLRRFPSLCARPHTWHLVYTYKYTHIRNQKE